MPGVAATATAAASQSEREQQLQVQLLQQEAAIRELQAELDAARGSSGTRTENRHQRARPSTAGAGRVAALGRAAHRVEAAEATPLYDHFAMERTEPQGVVQPAPLEGHTAVPAHGKVFIFGGTNNHVISSDLWVYNVATRRWKRSAAQRARQASEHASAGDAERSLGRYGHTAVLYRDAGTMVVFGGFGPAGEGGAAAGTRCGLLASTVAYDLRSGEWTLLDTGADVEPVKNHAAVAVRELMYVVGGCLADGRTNAVRCFDMARRRWLDATPFNQQAISAAAALASGGGGGGGSAAGGATGSPSSTAAAATSALLARTDVPAPRSGHSANVFQQPHHAARDAPQIIVFGGRMSKHDFGNDAFQYDTASRAWSRMYCGGALPAPRCDHSAVVYRDHLVVFGGYALGASGGGGGGGGGPPADAQPSSASPKRYFADCYVLQLVSCTWTHIDVACSSPERPLGLCGHTAILYECPRGEICMQINGGWGAAHAPDALLDDDAERTTRLADGGDVAHCAHSASWTVRIARAPPPPPPSAQADRAECPRPHRPATASTRRPATGSSSRATGPRSPRATTESAQPPSRSGGKRPWTVHTSKAATAKEFGDPSFRPHPPCVRLQYQIDSIVRRLADEEVRRKEASLQRLREQFLREREPARLTPETQEESLDRLYYQQTEWRRERQQQLEAKWVPRRQRAEVDGDALTDIVARLATVPPKPQPTPPRSARRQSPRQAEECVKRLYDEQLDAAARRREELEHRYLWGGEAKRLSNAGVASLVDRLAAAPSPAQKRR